MIMKLLKYILKLSIVLVIKTIHKKQFNQTLLKYVLKGKIDWKTGGLKKDISFLERIHYGVTWSYQLYKYL